MRVLAVQIRARRWRRSRMLPRLVRLWFAKAPARPVATCDGGLPCPTLQTPWLVKLGRLFSYSLAKVCSASWTGPRI